MQELNFVIAFTSGVVSFFAPCVLPLVPVYVSYISGVSLNELRKERGTGVYKRQVFISSLFYVFGFSIIFVILGTTAASLGMFFRQYSDTVQRIGGILIMLFALNFIGVLKIPVLMNSHQIKLPGWISHLGYGKAFLIGVVFATAWTPCVGAVLGSILTLAAITQTAASGAILLFVYSLGISVPFLLISVLMAQAPVVLKFLNNYLRTISAAVGILLFIIGFLVFNNTLGLISDKLTYNHLNSILFEIAFSLGYQVK